MTGLSQARIGTIPAHSLLPFLCSQPPNTAQGPAAGRRCLWVRRRPQGPAVSSSGRAPAGGYDGSEEGCGPSRVEEVIAHGALRAE